MTDPENGLPVDPEKRYSVLDPDEIVSTIRQLHARIGERFPESGLRKVCGRLLEIGRQARRRSIEISKPIRYIRGITWATGTIFVLAPVVALLFLPPPERKFTQLVFLEMLDWITNEVVYFGLAVIFLVTLEIRIKRRRALHAIHELRSIAHIVDMHQLTKDPDSVMHPGHDTASSPKRKLERYELARYLDYCSEMLALIGKIAALYVQRFQDAGALAAVNEVEELTSGLSRKIWQKVMILDMGPDAPGSS